MRAPNPSIISFAVLLAAAATAQAQQASAPSCNGKDPVGYIGISGIACNCTISLPNSGVEWRFRTEPKITSLEMDSRAARVLKVGDFITAVNEKLITTREGAQELANLKPGVPVVLTLRREGQAIKVALTPESLCPNDSRALGIYAPAVVAGKAPPAAYVGEVPAATPAPRGYVVATPPPQGWTAPAKAPVAYATVVPRATFGMGLSCSNCAMTYSEKDNTRTMSFTRPPEVYSIERGGPADRAGIRRGDVITHVDGKPIDSHEGGRIFASATPGQTVKFTVVRNNQRKVYTVRAVARTSTASVLPPPELAQSSRNLERARESLIQLQRSQDDQLRRLREETGRAEQMQTETLREAQRRMLREEEKHRRELALLADQMSVVERQMRAAIVDSARASCVVTGSAWTPLPSAAPAARAGRTLRYTGTLGDAEIEVRGANPVSITEDGDEIVITTGATVVRVQKKK